MIQAHYGDCLEFMGFLADGTIDTVLTDPPYGLEFMGKEWDSFSGDGFRRRENPADAGRPNVFGRMSRSGPEYDTHGATAEIVREGTDQSHPFRDGSKRIRYGHGPTAFQAYMLPIFTECLRVAKPGASLMAFGGSRTFHRLACAIEDAGWEIRDCLIWLYGTGFPKGQNIGKAFDKAAGAERRKAGKAVYGEGHVQNSGAASIFGTRDAAGDTRDVTLLATDLGELWEGWNTALKPAWEPIIWAMKPFPGSFTRNAERHGVAGIYIDGCRIEGEPWTAHEATGLSLGAGFFYGGPEKTPVIHKEPHALGRWPANVLLDEEAAAMLDAQSGTAGGDNRGKCAGTRPGGFANVGAAAGSGEPCGRTYADRGGASRFFARFIYCPKASKRERGAANNHPTVKPLAVMQWLARLTKTPTGGLVLDPFAGSGTTGLACAAEGRDCLLVERDPAYYRIIRERLRGGEQ